MPYAPHTFNIPALKGLSQKQIDIHLELYAGYVKHVNLIVDKIAAYTAADPEGNAFAISEMRRRFGFEFDGMRMHEYYFEVFEGGSVAPSTESALANAVKEKYASWDAFIANFKEVCGTRGIGWTILYYDPRGKTLHTAWINEHELGQLATLPVVLAIDMWEHAYMVDYMPSEKKSYVEAFLDNVNWKTVEDRFSAAKAS